MPVDLATKTRPTLAKKAVNGHDPGSNQAHWLLHDNNAGDLAKARLDSISDSNLGLFEVFIKRRAWNELEGAGSGTTSGAIDLEIVRRDLEQAAERGIPYMLLVENRSFSDPATDVAPSDLVSQWQAASGTRRTVCMFHATPRTRYINLLKAIVNEFKDHEYFAGVQGPGETSGQATVGGATYSLALDQTGWNTLISEMVNHCAYTYFCFGWNFMEGLGGGATTSAIQTAWNAVLSGVSTAANLVTFTPDIILPGGFGWTGLNHRVYPLFNTGYYTSSGISTSFTNCRMASSMQWNSHRFSSSSGHDYYRYKGDPTAESNANDLNSDGIPDMHEQLIWAIRTDRLNLDIVIWTHVDYPNGSKPTTGVTFFTMDRTDHTNGFGTTYGDDIGAIRVQNRLGWANTTHVPLYRNG